MLTRLRESWETAAFDARIPTLQTSYTLEHAMARNSAGI